MVDPVTVFMILGLDGWITTLDGTELLVTLVENGIDALQPSVTEDIKRQI